jgi:hypothetical protein
MRISAPSPISVAVPPTASDLCWACRTPDEPLGRDSSAGHTRDRADVKPLPTQLFDCALVVGSRGGAGVRPKYILDEIFARVTRAG